MLCVFLRRVRIRGRGGFAVVDYLLFDLLFAVVGVTEECQVACHGRSRQAI